MALAISSFCSSIKNFCFPSSDPKSSFSEPIGDLRDFPAFEGFSSINGKEIIEAYAFIQEKMGIEDKKENRSIDLGDRKIETPSIFSMKKRVVQILKTEAPSRLKEIEKLNTEELKNDQLRKILILVSLEKKLERVSLEDKTGLIILEIIESLVEIEEIHRALELIPSISDHLLQDAALFEVGCFYLDKKRVDLAKSILVKMKTSTGKERLAQEMKAF